MSVLVVEDEAKVAQFLGNALRAEGLRPEICADYAELESHITCATLGFEILILDRMLHGKDSTRLIPTIRSKYPECKILILSAISTHEERAKVLDLGADDYLGKPFSLVELMARIRALSRRQNSAGAISTLLLSDLKMDLAHRTVHVDQLRVDLTNKEFQLLLLLLKTPGRVFSKYQLLDRVWDIHTTVETNVVEATVRSLRAKLQEARSQAVIQNRRNVGYWIEG